MNILIPMAGEGSRFAKAGYTFPKPLIEVRGKPMIQRVVENFTFHGSDDTFIFLVRKSHLDTFTGLESFLRSLAKNTRIIQVDELTEGAACTALLAKKFINSSEPLLIVNSDQIVEFSKENFLMLCETLDSLGLLVKSSYGHLGGIVFVFNSSHPKWSFVRLRDRLGNFSIPDIVEVAEKRVISNIATCGVYYYFEGSTFVKSAEAMIEKNCRVNNEFYIAPAYNEAIANHQEVFPFYVDKMWSLGTPEDLETYLNDTQG